MQKTLQFFCGTSVAVILELLKTKKGKRKLKFRSGLHPKAHVSLSDSSAALRFAIALIHTCTHGWRACRKSCTVPYCRRKYFRWQRSKMQKLREEQIDSDSPFSPSHSHSVLSHHLHCAPERRKDVGGPQRRHATLSCGTALDSSHGRHWNGKRRLMLWKDGLNVQRLDICSSKHTNNHTYTAIMQLSYSIYSERILARLGEMQSRVLISAAHRCSRTDNCRFIHN